MLHQEPHGGEGCPTQSCTVEYASLPEVTQREFCPIRSSTGKSASTPAATQGRALPNPQLHGVAHFYNSSHPGESSAQPATPPGRAPPYKQLHRGGLCQIHSFMGRGGFLYQQLRGAQLSPTSSSTETLDSQHQQLNGGEFCSTCSYMKESVSTPAATRRKALPNPQLHWRERFSTSSDSGERL